MKTRFVIVILLFVTIACSRGGETKEVLQVIANNKPPSQGFVSPSKSLDELVHLAVDDLNAFWEDNLDDYQPPYGPISYTLDTIDQIQEQAGCMLLPNNAASYCQHDKTIYYNRDFLERQGRKIGDYVPILIIAHEWGHAIQDYRKDSNYQKAVIELELEADCFAGAYTAHAQKISQLLEDDDLDEAVKILYEAGDILDADDPHAHGTSFERIGAFNTGKSLGIGHCQEIILRDTIDKTTPTGPTTRSSERNRSVDASTPTVNPDKLKTMYQSAKSHIKDGNLDKALFLLQQISLEDPNYADVALLIRELSVTPTPTKKLPTSTPTSTSIPPTTTPVPVGENCSRSPGNTFSGMWQNYRQELGCPTTGQTTIPTMAEQLFQGGHMFWRSDTNEVYVIYDKNNVTSGSWQTDRSWDWGAVGEPAPDGIGLSPPAGLFEPKRGFGWVWREFLGREQGALGWAYDKEYGFDNTGLVQGFEYGMMFKGSSPRIYVLLYDGRFFAR